MVKEREFEYMREKAMRSQVQLSPGSKEMLQGRPRMRIEDKLMKEGEVKKSR